MDLGVIVVVGSGVGNKKPRRHLVTGEGGALDSNNEQSEGYIYRFRTLNYSCNNSFFARLKASWKVAKSKD